MTICECFVIQSNISEFMNPPHLAINPRNDNMLDIMSNAKINLGSILSLSGEASQDARGIRDGIELAIKKTKRQQSRCSDSLY